MFGLRHSVVNPFQTRPSLRYLSASCWPFNHERRIYDLPAAKQSEAAVRDYVTPLVRGDVHSTQLNAVAPPPSEVDALTADYIRIATERLC